MVLLKDSYRLRKLNTKQIIPEKGCSVNLLSVMGTGNLGYFINECHALAGKEDKPHTVLCLQRSDEARCEQYLTVIVLGAIQLPFILQSVEIHV